MTRQIPMVLQDVNVFIDGKGYLGATKQFKIPTLEQDTIEAKGAVGANLGTGNFKAMETEITIKVLDLNTYTAMGLNTITNRIPFLLKGAIYQSGGTRTEAALALTGDITAIEHSDLEAGGEVEVTIKLAVQFCTLTVDGKPLLVYDWENLIAIVGGVDYMAKVRSILGE